MVGHCFSEHHLNTRLYPQAKPLVFLTALLCPALLAISEEQDIVYRAEADQNAGMAALDNGDHATALNYFDAAEQNLGRG